MFGRRKRKAADEDVLEEEILDETGSDEDEEDSAAEDVDDADADAPGDDEPEAELDEWQRLDASRDWREEGPFDLSEVDLDADDVERMDFDALILTPFDGMQLQLQVNQQTQQLQAILAVSGQSVMELSLFAAPANRDMRAEVRDEMIANAQKAGGKATLTAGPFGTEVRRVVPITTQQGQHGYHVSRTWFAQGPRWLLRGVLMGEAGLAEGVEGSTELLYELFANTVVRRGDKPKVPGELIPMTMSPELAAQTQQKPAGAR
ncbi:DUF3710 domain-containing protein [Propionibacterium australiense]|uniref:DUF3710 domain-containing protein n=1 Tax=Propionibacterium australiense TaxID=119981 RepID=A0A383S4U7_9ACTN|nr:DUF3710 domain-containing protein [Propionibacterium australiense]RLP10675.1 DUF3710 domain-containing protein [Propionibacterium australiense]RLP12970.1 DUF3710 domain-containing protein [Propionibacterium australiense]SYZ32883.1 Protein of unknown function DUF3710 [Propionibacterium australiense]VEH91061.1 Protein of uncharacterised function (DUF3710) [Propionibacterium australiense]